MQRDKITEGVTRKDETSAWQTRISTESAAES